ncbi:MAG: amidohydrolase family protein [Lachnospiraceae bacterium]|nr:amidohydrolase family protein [Lachnospiraceae bacterium]
MNAKLFKNGLVLLNGRFKRTQILVIDGVIESVANTMTIPEGTEIIDCSGKRIIPGLIDIHTHGCAGYDFSTATPEEMHKMMKWYAQRGITSVLPTIGTDTKKNMLTGLKNLHTLYREQHMQKPVESHMVGIHMEGPFFGNEKNGAQAAEHLLPVDIQLFRELFLAGGGFIRIADIDPTLPGAFEFIDRYRKDFVISLAHTTCDYATAQRAAQAGVTQITHLFNGMNSMHHREPGLIGALYDLALMQKLFVMVSMYILPFCV